MIKRLVLALSLLAFAINPALAGFIINPYLFGVAACTGTTTPAIQTGAGTTDSDDATSPFNMNLPTSIASGNLLLAFLGGGGQPSGITWPAGWTEIYDYSNTGADAKYISGAYRIADGSEGSTISVEQSVEQAQNAYVVRITGACTTSPPEVGAKVNGASTSPDPPNLALAGWGTEDTLWFEVCSWRDEADTVSAVSASYTSRYNDKNNVTGVGNNGGLVVASRALNAASENPGTLTISSADWSCTTVAVRAD